MGIPCEIVFEIIFEFAALCCYCQDSIAADPLDSPPDIISTYILRQSERRSVLASWIRQSAVGLHLAAYAALNGHTPERIRPTQSPPLEIFYISAERFDNSEVIHLLVDEQTDRL
jgi:hypothetical protein